VNRASPMLKRAIALLLIGSGIAISAAIRPEGIEWSADNLRDWVSQWPLAPLAFTAIVVLRPFLLVPSALMMAAGGALFGTVAGAFYGVIGGALSALFTFWIVRSLGRDVVEPRLGARLQSVDAYLKGRGTTWIAAYTAFPATPLTIGQIACGLSSMPASRFALASIAGLIPRTALLAWFGAALVEANWLRASMALLLIALAILIGWRVLRKPARPTPEERAAP